MSNAWPLEVVEDGANVIAIWAKPDPDYTTLAIIGVQTEPDTEPWELTRVGTMDNARETARRLKLFAEETVNADRGVIRWIAGTN
jgi:hypothetical protein